MVRILESQYKCNSKFTKHVCCLLFVVQTTVSKCALVYICYMWVNTNIYLLFSKMPILFFNNLFKIANIRKYRKHD